MTLAVLCIRSTLFVVGVSQEVCTYPDMRGVSEYLGDGVTLNPDYVYADDNQCLTKRVVSTDTVEKPTYDNPLAELMGSTLTTLQVRVTHSIDDEPWTMCCSTISLNSGVLSVDCCSRLCLCNSPGRQTSKTPGG